MNNEQVLRMIRPYSQARVNKVMEHARNKALASIKDKQPNIESLNIDNNQVELINGIYRVRNNQAIIVQPNKSIVHG